MKEILDMIPIIFFTRDRQNETDWQESTNHQLIDAEYVDEDLVNLNIFGHRKDYQVQFKLSSFIKLLEAREIPLHSSGGTE